MSADGNGPGQGAATKELGKANSTPDDISGTDQYLEAKLAELEQVFEAAKAEAIAQAKAEVEAAGPDPNEYAADGRRRLDVANPAEAAERIRRTLGTEELSGIFRRSGELVHTPRIGEDGYIVPDDPTVDLGPAQIRPITAGQLATMVDIKYAVGAWVPEKKRGARPRSGSLAWPRVRPWSGYIMPAECGRTPQPCASCTG
jgi:hypothetical protein